jgi:uncharacterized membrane protein YjdF
MLVVHFELSVVQKYVFCCNVRTLLLGWAIALMSASMRDCCETSHTHWSATCLKELLYRQINFYDKLPHCCCRLTRIALTLATVDQGEV